MSRLTFSQLIELARSLLWFQRRHWDNISSQVGTPEMRCWRRCNLLPASDILYRCQRFLLLSVPYLPVCQLLLIALQDFKWRWYLSLHIMYLPPSRRYHKPSNILYSALRKCWSNALMPRHSYKTGNPPFRHRMNLREAPPGRCSGGFRTIFSIANELSSDATPDLAHQIDFKARVDCFRGAHLYRKIDTFDRSDQEVSTWRSTPSSNDKLLGSTLLLSSCSK